MPSARSFQLYLRVRRGVLCPIGLRAENFAFDPRVHLQCVQGSNKQMLLGVACVVDHVQYFQMFTFREHYDCLNKWSTANVQKANLFTFRERAQILNKGMPQLRFNDSALSMKVIGSLSFRLP